MPTLPDTALARRTLAIGLVASLSLYGLFYLPRAGWDYNFGYWVGRDFANFWAAGRLAWLGETHILFDVPRYNAWLAAELGDAIDGGMMYSYPPQILPLLVPFGMLPYGVALALWTAMSFAAVAMAARTLGTAYEGSSALALAAPALALGAFQGQMTGTLAALFCAGLGLRERRPIAAGVLLGLLTIKPQLGVVAGLIVLTERRWRLVGATVLTAAALAATATLLAGFETWQTFVTHTLPMHGRDLARFTYGATYFMATPYAAARALGLSAGFAMSAQVVCALAVVGVALRIWRHAADRDSALAIAALATVLALPYANIYDLALVALPLAAVLTRSPLAPPPAAAAYVVWLTPAIAMPLALLTGPIAGLALLLAYLSWAVHLTGRTCATSPPAHLPARV